MTANHNEQKIITAINKLKAQGITEFTGFMVDQQISKDCGWRWSHMGYGTLYRWLGIFESNGVLTSKWVGDEFPRKRVYSLAVSQ